jgi:pilus assembly protein CpaE
MSKILIVDDDPVMQKLVTGLLSKEGYQVDSAENGRIGLTALASFKPDLVISDVLMPEMDGYEFCIRVRMLPDGRNLPILMLTSLDSVEEKIKGFEVGADDYLVKSFEPRELLARVASLLKRSAAASLVPAVQATTARTIAVFSMRGGSGVSTIAANLAVGLSQIWGKPTILTDMVLTGGQSALFLNLALKNTWAEIAQYPAEEIEQELIQSAMLQHESGVLMLASPRRPEMSEWVTEEKVQKVLSLLKQSSEYLVLDCSHDFSSPTLAALDLADIKLVVIQPEIVSLRAAVMVLDTFLELGYDMENVHLILNWTFPRNGISREEIEKYLQKKISLVLPYAADELIESLNKGIPPTFSHPDKSLGMFFEKMAYAVSKNEHRQSVPENPSEGWKRIQEKPNSKRAK